MSPSSPWLRAPRIVLALTWLGTAGCPDETAPSSDAGPGAPVDADTDMPDAGPDGGNPPDAGHEAGGERDAGQPAGPPFALDCANLPSDGACQGGPREVLLVAEATGRVLMFDPGDGHYLGVFKFGEAAVDERRLWTATQGPDQCIWTSGTGEDHGVRRWETDGTFKDEVIPRGRFFEKQDDVIQSPLGLAFSEHEVFVASTNGEPNARLVRFALDELPVAEDDPDPASHFDIVIDDGSKIASLVVLGDGSMVVTNEFLLDGLTRQQLELRSPDGVRVRTLSEVFDSYPAPTQVTYAGGDDVLSGDSEEGTLFRVNVVTGEGTTPLAPVDSNNVHILGAYPLRNGQWLYTASGTVESLDLSSTNPTGQHTTLWDDPAVGARDFRYVGRACLSNEFVEARGAPEPIDPCDEPAGDALFRENFDVGDFTGTGDQRNFQGFYERPYEGVTVSVDPAQDAHGSGQSLKIVGGSDPLDMFDPQPSGVARAFEHLAPTYIGYYVRTDAQDDGPFPVAYFSLNELPYAFLESLFVYQGALSTAQSNVAHAMSPDTWLRVQMRNIDWSTRSYDLYIDCERVAEGIPFTSNGGSDLVALELFNGAFGGESTDATWYDEIVLK